MNHRPVAIGLVLCEQVILEEGTHNVTPVNCFNNRGLDDFPGEISFFALAWLTDGMGEMLVELVVERLDKFRRVLPVQSKALFPRPPIGHAFFCADSRLSNSRGGALSSIIDNRPRIDCGS